MSTQSQFGSQKRQDVPWRSKAYDGALPSPTVPNVAPANGISSSLAKSLRASLEKPSVVIAVGLIIILAIAVGFAFLQRELTPAYTVTVQQFEIAPELVTRLAISGKGASDIVIDMLNKTAAQGSRFSGAEYFDYAHHGIQPVALHQAIKVPVQSTYGIEVKGVSVDSLIKLYSRIRYREWIISGDILSSRDGPTVRIRLNRGDSASSWQVSTTPGMSLSVLIQNATASMLADENPELLGRSYLAQEQYQEATELFRRWALRDPSEWKPYYYLSLTYDYEGKEQESSSLARWSRDIAEQGSHIGSQRIHPRSASGTGTAAALAQITQAVWETKDVATTATLPGSLRLQQLATLKKSEHLLTDLCSRNQAEPTCEIQLARTLDKEATIEASLPNSLTAALHTETQAISIMTSILRELPTNGGLHEQHAVLLQNRVLIQKAAGADSRTIASDEGEEAAEFTRALELRPTNVSPLWGCVYALIDLKREEDAVDLTRTMMLLQPASTAAKTAYIVSLERAMIRRGRTKETETEVLLHLGALLKLADESEFQALWNSCADQHDAISLRKLAEIGRRRFPGNKTFRKLAS